MADGSLVDIIMEGHAANEFNEDTNEATELEKSRRIEEALNNNANVNEVVNGITPLIALILNTNKDGDTHRFYLNIIPRLIGRNIDFMGPEGSALHYALIEEQVQYMNALLENGANVNLQNARGETPLFIAAAWSRYDYVIHLINHGADVNIMDNQQRSPLNIVGRNNNNQVDETRTIEELCNRGARGPRCQELQEPRRLRARAVYNPVIARQMRNNNIAAQRLNAMHAAQRFLLQRSIRVPDVSEGVKVVPEDKRTNAISYEDIADGDDIIVITEANGAEFFYNLETIRDWFNARERAGLSKTNPGTGKEITSNNQVTRWTAQISRIGGLRRKRRVKKTRKTKRVRRKTRKTGISLYSSSTKA